MNRRMDKADMVVLTALAVMCFIALGGCKSTVAAAEVGGASAALAFLGWLFSPLMGVLAAFGGGILAFLGITGEQFKSGDVVGKDALANEFARWTNQADGKMSSHDRSISIIQDSLARAAENEAAHSHALGWVMWALGLVAVVIVALIWRNNHHSRTTAEWRGKVEQELAKWREKV